LSSEIGGEPVKVPFFSPLRRILNLKNQCYLLSEELLLARFDNDWEKVIEITRTLFYLSDYWRFIEPYYVNIPEFFALGVQ